MPETAVIFMPPLPWPRVPSTKRETTSWVCAAIASILLNSATAAMAAPSPEIAKKCLRTAYMMYPYKRPGAAPMRGDRLFFYERCVAEQGDVTASRPSPASIDENAPGLLSR